MKEFTEKEIREALRGILEENKNPKNILKEQYAVNVGWDELYAGLIEPWINVLKIAKVEAQKTLANVLFLFKVAITFNAQKLQNLTDRHKDRQKMLDNKTQELLNKYPTTADGTAIAFMLNPGAYIAGKAISAGSTGASEVADFFRESGFGDWSPGELESPDGNAEKRARERDQSNPIFKALRALDSLFMAGYEAPGSILIEQPEEPEEELEEDYSEVTITEDSINTILELSGAFSGLKQAQDQLEEDAKEFLSSVKNAKSLTDVLASSKKISNLSQYMDFLEEIKKISPETATTSKAALESALESDVKKILASEGAEDEAAQSYLKSQGITDPTEEEKAGVTEEQKMSQIRAIAFGNILGRLRAGAEESINGIYTNHKSLYDTLYSENIDPVVKSIVDNSPYGKSMEEAKKILEEIKRSSVSLGA